MNWQGKALGAVVGAFAAGPVGALLGAFVGHLYDAQPEMNKAPGATQTLGLQEAYFRAVFEVMGRIAKSDGRVSEEEIRAARAMMQEFRLGERETRYAMELFNQGKRPDYPLDVNLNHLRTLCGQRTDLCRMFVQIQVQAALRGGSLDHAGRAVLARVCAALDVSAYDVIQMEALLRMQQATRAQGERASTGRLAGAYEVLGVASNAADVEVTRAYRRLMNQNHPDKLHAKGLPESMMALAAEKTRQVREAYDIVRDARGMR